VKPTPTGRITATADGTYDLILSRRFDARADDVWASVTEPERMARWFGTWRGEPGTGRTVQLKMGFEGDHPWTDVRIDECRPPHHLAVSAVDESGEWHLELTLTEADGATRLELVQHRVDPAAAESMGPGWEYYLDMLVAAREGQPQPDFNDYYPAQAAHFQVPPPRAAESESR
jgi:uncharacterized protein YndB with AHSA1/START domain